MNPIVRFCLRTLVTFLSFVTFCVVYLPFLPKDDISARRLGEYDFSKHSHEGEQWVWQTWVMAILIVIVCGGGQLFCLCNCIRAGLERGDFLSNAGGIYTPLKEEELVVLQNKPDHDKIGHVLRREMRFMLLFPIIPVLAFNQTSCENGMPWWGYLLYLPLLVRAKWIEVKIMQALNYDLKLIFSMPGFWLGCLEHADWFTDGALPVQAYLCDPSVTQSFAESFEMSWAWPLAPLVRTLHFWGLLTLTLSSAGLTQQLVGAVNAGAGSSKLAADVPGFGAVADWYEKNPTDESAPEERSWLSVRDRAWVTSISKVLFENVMQLWLQASFFALIFDRLDHDGRVKLLFSMGLGLLGCLAKILQVILFGFCEAQATGRMVCYLMVQMVAVICVAWTAAKLYQSFHCESHIWNLTTGCVPKEMIEHFKP